MLFLEKNSTVLWWVFCTMTAGRFSLHICQEQNYAIIVKCTTCTGLNLAQVIRQ